MYSGVDPSVGDGYVEQKDEESLTEKLVGKGRITVWIILGMIGILSYTNTISGQGCCRKYYSR